MIYLISEKIAVEMSERLGGDLEKWENNNLNFSSGYWITDRSVEKVRKAGLEINYLTRRVALQIFWGSLDDQYRNYKDELSAICISRFDGTQIRALSYLEPFSDYRFCHDLQRCFVYSFHQKENQNWHVIGHSGDIEWLKGYWANDAKFLEWISQNGGLLD